MRLMHSRQLVIIYNYIHVINLFLFILLSSNNYYKYIHNFKILHYQRERESQSEKNFIQVNDR